MKANPTVYRTLDVCGRNIVVNNLAFQEGRLGSYIYDSFVRINNEDAMGRLYEAVSYLYDDLMNHSSDITCMSGERSDFIMFGVEDEKGFKSNFRINPNGTLNKTRGRASDEVVEIIFNKLREYDNMSHLKFNK